MVPISMEQWEWLEARSPMLFLVGGGLVVVYAGLHVISSCSTCTFPDPIAALNEMGWVCKPDGQIRLLEHHKWDAPVLGRVTEWMNEGEYERVGCRLYEDPTAVVRDSELEVITDRRWRLPPFTGITARPPTTADT